jgi:uncharacterized HAD superfamily protein
LDIGEGTEQGNVPDRLEQLFSRQLDNQKLFTDLERLSETERQSLTEKLLLHLYSEGNSLLDNINWKLNIIKRKSPDISNVHIEIIDMAKYVFALSIIWGMNANEFYNQFLVKSSVVEERYDKEKVELRDEKILAVDVDGILADWFGGLLLYAEQYYERKFCGTNLTNHHISAVKSFEISKVEEEELKAAFIESGGYKRLSSMGGQKQLANAKTQGYKNLLLTSRPEKRHKRAYGDTIEWLHSKGYQYDFIFFGANKPEVIAEDIYPGTITFLIEDRLDNAIAIAKSYPETKIILFNRPYNITKFDDTDYPNIIRVDTWEEVEEII